MARPPGLLCAFLRLPLSLETSLDLDVDVVVSEYNCNDGFLNTVYPNEKVHNAEQLARRIMTLNNNPALVYLQVGRRMGGGRR